jgi:hypothetical protein
MSYSPQEEACPISEQLLFALYEAAKRGLPVPVSEVPQERRSSVALFCYRRSHLERAALAVAATCDEEDLVHIGGPLGQTLFEKSRTFAQNASFDRSRIVRLQIATQPTVTDVDEDESE